MQHATLENGRWAELSFSQQMANIGSETSRVYKAIVGGKESRAESSFARFQELIDLTIRYGRQNESAAARSAMRKELCRFRELYCGAYLSKDLEALSAANRYLDLFALRSAGA
jgi:hypothetical protein